MSQQNTNDPLALVRQMWSSLGFNLPGMVVPTFDGDELGKRISDLKAVEGWLSMNLSMLQMTIRSLEMQRTTIETVRAMGEMASQAGKSAPPAAGESDGATPGMWPWAMMQQMHEHLQNQAEAIKNASPAPTVAKPRQRQRKKT